MATHDQYAQYPLIILFRIVICHEHDSFTDSLSIDIDCLNRRLTLSTANAGIELGFRIKEMACGLLIANKKPAEKEISLQDMSFHLHHIALTCLNKFVCHRNSESR